MPQRRLNETYIHTSKAVSITVCLAIQPGQKHITSKAVSITLCLAIQPGQKHIPPGSETGGGCPETAYLDKSASMLHAPSKHTGVLILQGIVYGPETA